MTNSPVASRRRFIAGLGAASVAGLAHAAIGEGQDESAVAPVEAKPSDHLLSPGLVYLNTASLGTTPLAVLERTTQAWRELESNPVRNAYRGGAALAAADEVRARAGAFLGCDADEILITRSTTEGMNTVAQGLHLRAGDRVLTTDQEHHGGSLCWRYQERHAGVHVDQVTIAPGDYDTAAMVKRFADAITPATRVISVSHVISATGLRMPIVELAALARERGIVCVVDGAQAVGGFAVDVKALGCHAYATSGHKWLQGPKGTGLLYVSRDAESTIAPIQWEDGHGYGAESAGVGPMTLAVGLGAAIESMRAIGMAEVERRDLALRNRAYEGLMQMPRLRVVSPPGPLATALVACILPDEIDSEVLRATLLDKYGIVVKKNEKRQFNGIRISPHLVNTEADIDAFLRALRVELG